jgi:hypothetical protein
LSALALAVGIGVTSGRARSAYGQNEAMPPSGAGAVATTAVDVTPRSIKWIPPGTHVGSTPPSGWSHLLFVAHPRLAQGDVDELPPLAAKLATSMTVSMLANVVRERTPEGHRYRLEKVCVGFGKTIRGRNIIISSQTHRRLRARLGLVGSHVLAKNEEIIRRRSRQVARTPTMSVLDFSVIILYQGEHRRMIRRYVILVCPATGALGALVGLLDPQENDSYAVAASHMLILPLNYRQDKKLHVDATKFVGGIPSPDAIAQIDDLQGTPIVYTPTLRRSFTPRRFDHDTALALERELLALWKAER